MRGFLAAFDELAARSGARSVLEAGCGEGELSLRLAACGCAVRGFDIGAPVIAQARAEALRRGLDARFTVASLAEYRLAPGEPEPELVVCCEVLEHLADPEEGLAALCALTRRYVLVSVPREPLWRILNCARGAYWPALGNTPGHVQHWSSRGFVKFLAARLRVIAVRRPLPWTMVLGELPGC
jgi:SAM-dependent methyltransferase